MHGSPARRWVRSASHDSALSTWTVSTIADPSAALSELRTVLPSGGRLFFVEDGAVPDRAALRWQRWWYPCAANVP